MRYMIITIICIMSSLTVLSCNSDNLSGNKSNSAVKTFSLNSITDGKSYSQKSFEGKPLILNFWASWCAPCREEMPFLEESWKNYKNKEIELVGINVNDDKDAALKTLKEFEISYVNLFDPEGKLSNSYGIIALPVTIFINREGNIYKQQYGPFLGEKGEQTFNNYLEEIL